MGCWVHVTGPGVPSDSLSRPQQAFGAAIAACAVAVMLPTYIVTAHGDWCTANKSTAGWLYYISDVHLCRFFAAHHVLSTNFQLAQCMELLWACNMH
jgi:hypothetical protein